MTAPISIDTFANQTQNAQAPSNLNLRTLLDEMVAKNASDLHLVAGDRPKLRVDGEIIN